MKPAQNILPEKGKPSDKELLREVAQKLSNKLLFRDQVEKAKSYLNQVAFPTKENFSK